MRWESWDNSNADKQQQFFCPSSPKADLIRPLSPQNDGSFVPEEKHFSHDGVFGALLLPKIRLQSSLLLLPRASKYYHRRPTVYHILFVPRSSNNRPSSSFFPNPRGRSVVKRRRYFSYFSGCGGNFLCPSDILLLLLLQRG